MIKPLILFACFLIIIFPANCQSSYYRKDKIDKNYFELLFSNNVLVNNPRTIIKMEIKEGNKFFITTKGEIQEYFKSRFSVNDSAAEKMTFVFLSNDGKISYADSATFANIQKGKVYFYSDTILNKFRKLSLVDLLNQYFPILRHTENIFPIVYLYEMGIFYNWDSKNISIYTIDTLRLTYGIFWDNDTKKWVQK